MRVSAGGPVSADSIAFFLVFVGHNNECGVPHIWRFSRCGHMGDGTEGFE
jgi:hypothetical protein